MKDTLMLIDRTRRSNAIITSLDRTESERDIAECTFGRMNVVVCIDAKLEDRCEYSKLRLPKQKLGMPRALLQSKCN